MVKIPKKFKPAPKTVKMRHCSDPSDVISVCTDHAKHFLTVDKYVPAGPSPTDACQYCAEFAGVSPGNGYPTDRPEFQPRADASTGTLLLSAEMRLAQVSAALASAAEHLADAVALLRGAKRRRQKR